MKVTFESEMGVQVKKAIDYYPPVRERQFYSSDHFYCSSTEDHGPGGLLWGLIAVIIYLLLL